MPSACVRVARVRYACPLPRRPHMAAWGMGHADHARVAPMGQPTYPFRGKWKLGQLRTAGLQVVATCNIHHS